MCLGLGARGLNQQTRLRKRRLERRWQQLCLHHGSAIAARLAATAGIEIETGAETETETEAEIENDTGIETEVGIEIGIKTEIGAEAWTEVEVEICTEVELRTGILTWAKTTVALVSRRSARGARNTRGQVHQRKAKYVHKNGVAYT